MKCIRAVCQSFDQGARLNMVLASLLSFKMALLQQPYTKMSLRSAIGSPVQVLARRCCCFSWVTKRSCPIRRFKPPCSHYFLAYCHCQSFLGISPIGLLHFFYPVLRDSKLFKRHAPVGSTGCGTDWRELQDQNRGPTRPQQWDSMFSTSKMSRHLAEHSSNFINPGQE